MSRSKSALIDAYTHCNTLGFLRELSRGRSPAARRAAESALSESEMFPQFHDAERRLADLDRFGFSAQVTMPNNMVDPNGFALGAKQRARLCRSINDEMSGLASRSRGRIAALGTVPLASPAEALEEMRRAIEDLGLKGFMVLTNLQGKPVDEFDWFWDEAAKLEAAVYIHPSDPHRKEKVPYEEEFQLSRVLGWPYETGLMMTRLVLKGTFQKHPGLKVVVHHMGGVVPFLAGRIEEWYTRRASPLNTSRLAGTSVKGSPFEPFRSFYYDTTVGGNRAAFRCGYELLGAERIVFATDYPWGPDGGRGRLSTYPEMVRGSGLSAGELEEIFEGNVTRMLGL